MPLKTIFTTERIINGKRYTGPNLLADSLQEAEELVAKAMPDGVWVVGQLVLPWWKQAWYNIRDLYRRD